MFSFGYLLIIMFTPHRPTFERLNDVYLTNITIKAKF